MIKGPLVYAAVILAALLMIVSAVMVLARDFFQENMELIVGISGALAIAVIAVLIMMLIRMRKAE
ncbi:MAG: hypothetical protein E7Z65_04835 [Thermoplasmata archaeon]|nr:hypothetical protein [Thermoplasmata archaeon]